MADATESMVPRCCILWTVKKPNYRSSQRSPDFTFQDCKCRLELVFQRYSYDLYVMSPDPNFSVPYEATVYDLTSFEERTTKHVDTLGFPVWSVGEFNMAKVVYGTDDDPAMRFRVVLEDCSRSVGPKVVVDQFVQTPTFFDIGPHLQALSRDFAQLLDEGSDRDVEFVCGGREFKGHGLVLCTRSKVLKAMIESDTHKGKIVEEMEVAFFEVFLKYLYAGILPEITKDTITRIYKAADKYDMKELMQACLVFLENNLSVDNACEAMIIADHRFSRHGDREMKAKVLRYIKDKNIPLVNHLWNDFSHRDLKLAHDVLIVYCKHLAYLAGVKPGE